MATLSKAEVLMSEKDEPIEVDLAVSTDQVGFLIAKAREVQVKDEPVTPDSASNATDDNDADVLESGHGDASLEEVFRFIRAMTEDEQVDLVALMWVGRGDFDIAEWDEARAIARERHNERTAEYLLGTQMFPDFLADGVAAAGRSWADEAAVARL
jgi:Protein of unknown function (DUF3775)